MPRTCVPLRREQQGCGARNWKPTARCPLGCLGPPWLGPLLSSPGLCFPFPTFPPAPHRQAARSTTREKISAQTADSQTALTLDDIIKCIVRGVRFLARIAAPGTPRVQFLRPLYFLVFAKNKSPNYFPVPCSNRGGLRWARGGAIYWSRLKNTIDLGLNEGSNISDARGGFFCPGNSGGGLILRIGRVDFGEFRKTSPTWL